MNSLSNSILAVAVCALSASSASALSIDFGTATRALADSLSFSIGGYTAKVTAATTDENGNVTGTAKVAQFGLPGPNQGGLGITNGVGDGHMIDGAGVSKDLLIITFDKPVKLNHATFANVGGFDDASIWADGLKLGTYALASHPTLLPLNSIGTIFGFGATGKNDSFKLRSIDFDATTVSTIPLPGAAFLLGTGLLGLIGVRRRSTK